MVLKPKVYLADLRHKIGDQTSNPCMPLGMAYMKAVMDRDLPEVASKIFAYPDHLLEEMKSNPPDVLMLTNYVWNEQLARYFTRVVKQIQPETLVVVGGPNIPVELERQMKFFDGWEDLDAYALGEGDFLATEIVSRFLDVGKSVTKLAKAGIPSSIFRSDNMLLNEPSWSRERDLGKIPSPWLNGVQDLFFDGQLIPLIETNRGCPFKCTFCVQGTQYYNRLSHFNADQVKEELTYIAKRIRDRCPNMGALTVADPNYGMYKRDVEISAHIGSLQKKFNWPSLIDCSTGKNAPDLIIKSIENTNGAMLMLHAVQSMDDGVLDHIKRSNIKLDTYEKVTEHLGSKGLRTFSQTILGLPGETLKTHLTGLERLIDQGVNSIQSFQLMLLNGSEIESNSSRSEFKFESKFRISPRCFGVYDGRTVFDMEEVVISTNSFSFADYIFARQYHLAYMVFWSQDWFNDLFRYARNFGLKYSICAKAMVEEIKSDNGALGEFMREFIEETHGELFSTREECAEFYSEKNNFEKLERGEIGDNLLNKYRARASFLLWPQVCQLATKVVRELVLNQTSDKLDAGFDLFWDDLCRFVEYRHAYGETLDDILTPVNCQLRYDISQWISDGHPKDFSTYKLKTPKSFLFKLTEISAREIRNAIDTWSTDLCGLTKVARHLKVTSQVRQCF
jgi:radical SAM superfamily enzyme YgiQ (UPF0313 family)